MPRFVELSHTIVAGMRTYPGLPAPVSEVLFDHKSSRPRYNNEAEFFIASLHLCGNTGTYVDSPFHRFPEGIDLAELPLERLAHLEFVVIDARRNAGRGIGPEAFANARFAGKAVLVYTGWSQLWGTESYFGENPFLTEDACRLLRDEGCVFAGIDSLNIDDINDLRRPAHTTLLGAGIPVCEHMTRLGEIGPAGGFLHAVPLKWEGGATFPVRAYIVRP